MSKLRYLLVALLALFFMVPYAGAGINDVHVNIEGTGDLLLYPFFYADSGIETKISVTNTCAEYGVVAKVVLRSSMCSEELRDFLIFLSPNDVWTATIKLENGKAVLRSTDESVVFNGKSASETNPFVVSLRMPANPADTNQFGYIEVITLAYVDFNWTDGTNTFKTLMTLNGFSNPHEFMYFLYKPTTPGQYNNIAYCPNRGNFKGIILPADYDSFANAAIEPKCDGTTTSIDDSYLPEGSLYGFAEVTIPGGYAAYRATAIYDFVQLGDEISDYKVLASLDTPLDVAGDVNMLDDALMKQQVYVPYYNTDCCGSFAMLFFPTMQSKYGYNPIIDKYTCIPTKNTSAVWAENGAWRSGLKIGVRSYDLSEHGVSCELSPCLLKFFEIVPIGPVEDIFDPYAFDEGWIRIDLGNDVSFISEIGSVSAFGLPGIPLAGHYNSEGVTFIDPPYAMGCDNYTEGYYGVDYIIGTPPCE